MSYSPSSGRETKELQQDDVDETAIDDDIDRDNVKVLPGTGGPDDAGDTSTGGVVDPDVDRGRD